jgi:hypothetical protein
LELENYHNFSFSNPASRYLIIMATTPRSARATLPKIYQYMLLTIEPIFALNGARIAIMDPPELFTIMTGRKPPFDTGSTFLYTGLAAAWAVFAFNEAVVLRMFDDLRLWTMLCWGMLLSDMLYLHSTAQALGGWGEWIQVDRWRIEDWLVMASSFGPFLVRVLVILKVGFKREGQVKTS